MEDWNNDCPTAILVDVPNSLNNCVKQCSAVKNNKHDWCQEDKLIKCKSFVQDVEQQEYSCSRRKCSAVDDSDYSYDITAVKNQLSPPRFSWKTPSPLSMSRIRKEASKIIHNLNSSTLFDEDSLICDEILPIPFNFDNFDLDANSDKEDLLSSTENSGPDKLSNHKSSVSVQTEVEVINSEMSEVVDISSTLRCNFSVPEDENGLAQSLPEPFNSKLNLKGEDSIEHHIIPEELKSSEIQTDSLNSDFSASNERTEDNFIKSSISSEDKENILGKEYEEILHSKIGINRETTKNISLMSKKKMENHGRLSNLSNVKHTIDSRNLPNGDKNVIPSRKVNAKELLFPRKQLLKKTTSAMETRTAPNMVPRSNSFQYNCRRESISSFKKPHANKQDASFLSNSEYKSSSSDVTHAFFQMKAPSKRCSIATPLKITSTKKPAVTPAFSNIQKPQISRYTSHSVECTRFSFSKSWQHPNVSNSKSFRCQNSTTTSLAVTTPSFSEIYLSKPKTRQSISTLSCQASEKKSVSTSSKKRFCSKLGLPSPLFAKQDKQLARTLFPSIPPK